MNDYSYLFIFIGVIGILAIVGYFAFIVWLIKKGVKNALNEFFTESYEDILEDIKYAITDGILSALEQYENKNDENSKESIDE